MECIVLGSGTAIPHPRRGSAGYVLRSGPHTLLMDTGMGTLQKLAILGISLTELDAVACSHLHLDHTAELPALLFALKSPELRREKPLTLYGGPGFLAFHEGLKQLYGSWIQPDGFPVHVEEIPNKTIALGPWRVTAVPVAHTPQSVAFRVEDPAAGRVLVYSGDTDACEGMVLAARDADVAILECSFPNERKVPGHLTPFDAGRIATEAGVRKLVLSHFYPSCEQADVLRQCREAYRGEIVLAEDLMRITV